MLSSTIVEFYRNRQRGQRHPSTTGREERTVRLWHSAHTKRVWKALGEVSGLGKLALFLPDCQIQHWVFIMPWGSGRARNVFLWLYLPCSSPKAGLANRPAFWNTGTRSTLVTSTCREGFAFPRNRAFEHILSLFRRMKSLPKDLSLTQLAPQTDPQWFKGNAVSPLPGDGNQCYTSVL